MPRGPARYTTGTCLYVVWVNETVRLFYLNYNINFLVAEYLTFCISDMLILYSNKGYCRIDRYPLDFLTKNVKLSNSFAWSQRKKYLLPEQKVFSTIIINRFEHGCKVNIYRMEGIFLRKNRVEYHQSDPIFVAFWLSSIFRHCALPKP